MSKERRSEIKKKQKTGKLIVIIAVALAVIIALGVTLAFNIHSCDDCGEMIFGRGYYKEKESEGVLGSLFGTVFGDTEGIPLETVDGVIICEKCAENNVSVKAELRPTSEFKR